MFPTTRKSKKLIHKSKNDPQFDIYYIMRYIFDASYKQ